MNTHQNSDSEQFLRGLGAVYCGSATSPAVCQHFGNPEHEQEYSSAGAVLVPVPQLLRIRVEGRDRQRFLHNFCTNDILGMVSGQFCEAFFVDVKARILAHGWILAGESWHEIWMLPGSETPLLRHLNKFIISEDVVVTSVTDGHFAFVVCGPGAWNAFAEAHTLQTSQLAVWGQIPSRILGKDRADNAGTDWIGMNWSGVPLVLCSCPLSESRAMLEEWSLRGGQFAGHHVFERMRLRERVPVIGVDLTHDHMAPEADRNATAISYVKGCYLGQEPIARLDAMGHINRGLRTFEAGAHGTDLLGAEVLSDSDSPIGVVTSFQRSFTREMDLGLSVMRLAKIASDSVIRLRTPKGDFPARVL